MRILLTGATGFIGQPLLHALLAEGHDVVCATRRPPQALLPRQSWVQADFVQDTGKSAWLARLTGIDAVINAVGIFREHGRQTFARLHTETPCALFAACAEAGVARVIQLSALGADEAADTAYHLSKKAADDALAALPLHATIVQPSLVYGPRGASARLLRALASLPLLPRLGHAPQCVQPIHLDDLCAAVVALLRLPAQAAPAGRLALVGPQALPFIDYLAALRAGMQIKPAPVLAVPDALARGLARLGALLPGALFDTDALRMLNRGNTADAGPVTRLLGRAPRPVASFITDAPLERSRARLDWLLPVLRLSLAVLWIATAAVSFGLYPVADSLALLAQTGIAPAWQAPLLYGAASLDLLLGLGIVLLRRRRWLWLAQMGLIGFYSVVIAIKLPGWWLHPYGPLTKNLPLLAALWLLYQLEDD